MLPMANNGAEVIYHKVIKPFVKKHEKTLDSAIDSATEAAKEVTQQGKWAGYILSKIMVLSNVQPQHE